MQYPCYVNRSLYILGRLKNILAINVKVRQQFTIMHLPVVPKYNIQCNYCNRSFDCINENRLGLTSEILTPALAIENYCRVKDIY